MDFEDQEEQEEEMSLPPSYDSSISTIKMSGSGGPEGPVGILSRHTRKPRYKECLKNHAVGIGGHAVDGCGEFMPAGADGTLDALKCAACNCHRNFHRKETTDSSNSGSGDFFFHHHHQAPQFAPFIRTQAGYLHLTAAGNHQRLLALPSASGGEDQEEDVSNQGMSDGRKRFRTKFTAEQKEKMLNLAAKLGWRVQKQDDEAIQEFCNETGVKRQVLKVWMHNNKHTLGKKP